MSQTAHHPLIRFLSGLLLLTTVSTAHALDPSMGNSSASGIGFFFDVPPGIWYEGAVRNFLRNGYLDGESRQFRPEQLATRAEVVKLLIEPNQGVLSTLPVRGRFDDVDRQAWYAAYVEEAASRVWLRGDGNCAGRHPCRARPSDFINRAEMAALIARVYALPRNHSAPLPSDIASNQWYADYFQRLADHCVLQATTRSIQAHPERLLNRAEVVVMLYRALHNPLRVTGSDCARIEGIENSSAAQTATRSREDIPPTVHHGHRGGNPHEVNE